MASKLFSVLLFSAVVLNVCFAATIVDVAVSEPASIGSKVESGKVYCPGGTSYCNDGNTCCLMPNHQWVCCPLPNAACCQDGYHCCASGYRCVSLRCVRVGEDPSPELIFLQAVKAPAKTL